MSAGQTVSDMIAARIRNLRKQRGWNAADLAARTNGRISENVIQNIEHGRPRNGVRTRHITADELAVLAAALGVPPATLMPGPGISAGHGLTSEVAHIIGKAIGQLEDLKSWYTTTTTEN